MAAVIDKDRASSLLARDLKADRLIILTAVDRVCVNFNKPDQRELPSMTLAEAEEYIGQKQFAPGSMLPKVQSCMEFVKYAPEGSTALITSLSRAADALEGKTGTILTKQFNKKDWEDQPSGPLPGCPDGCISGIKMLLLRKDSNMTAAKKRRSISTFAILLCVRAAGCLLHFRIRCVQVCQGCS